MSISGIPYAHSDAGGFAMTDKADPELYTRWLQFAAYTPIFRPHGSALGDDMTPEGTISLASEPAFWDDKTKAYALTTIRDRYKLLPYNYTLAWEQSEHGKPLMRPMMFTNASDSNLIKATDQYMWGPSLLIAPVLYPGQKSRRVYLPEGTWYRKEDHSIVNGDKWIEEPVVPDYIPVFVKGGSFVPFWTKENIINTEAFKQEAVIQVKWYPGIAQDTSFVYFDNGELPEANKDETQFLLMKWTSRKDGDRIYIQQTHSGKWHPQVQYVQLQIPSNGLKELWNGKGNRYRIWVNGEDYLGGKIHFDKQGTMSVLLHANKDNEIIIQNEGE
jgi:oligosaccharide 4-alpha-D-glucosyltransferase